MAKTNSIRNDETLKVVDEENQLGLGFGFDNNLVVPFGPVDPGGTNPKPPVWN